jgi:type I restriction enzyme M protein
MFRDVPVFKQARIAAQYSEEAEEALRSRRDFTDDHAAVVRALTEIGTAWNDLAQAFPKSARAAGLKTGASLVDAVMNAVAVVDDAAPPAIDRKGNPVIADNWKLTERVPLSEDLGEYMANEVLPFAPEAMCDESKARVGNEIPFTRIFYVPEEPRPLEKIDADVKRLMGELADMFAAVSHE